MWISQWHTCPTCWVLYSITGAAVVPNTPHVLSAKQAHGGFICGSNSFHNYRQRVALHGWVLCEAEVLPSAVVPAVCELAHMRALFHLWHWSNHSYSTHSCPGIKLLLGRDCALYSCILLNDKGCSFPLCWMQLFSQQEVWVGFNSPVLDSPSGQQFCPTAACGTEVLDCSFVVCVFWGCVPIYYAYTLPVPGDISTAESCNVSSALFNLCY